MKAKTRVNSTAALELEDLLRPARRLSLWHDAFLRMNQPGRINLCLVVETNQIIYHCQYRLLFSALHCLFASKHTCCDIRGPLVTVRGNSFRFQYSCRLCKQLIQTHPVQKEIQCKVDLQIFWKLGILYVACEDSGEMDSLITVSRLVWNIRQWRHWSSILFTKRELRDKILVKVKYRYIPSF